MSVAAPLALREGDEKRLTALVRSSSVRTGMAQRARIVLLAADGASNTATEKICRDRNRALHLMAT